MAPLRIDTAEPFNLRELGVRTISLLWSCFVLCIFLIIKRLRGRHNMPHIEQLTPFPAMAEKHVEGDLFDAQDPISALDRQLLTELLNPLLGVGPRQSSLITSGYLAAKAKMATAKKLAVLEPAQGQVEVIELSSPDLEKHSSFDYQKLQWSRRSSPGPQTAFNTSKVVTMTEDDEMEHLIQFGSLHNASKHDETRHFCDDHNPRIKWRRRTLIFEKKP